MIAPARETRPGDEPILEVRSLNKQFRVGGMFAPGRLHAVRDVSFSLHAGTVMALVGESGSGKSTTARLIAKLIPPTSGTILLAGTPTRRATPDYRRRVQMVFQDPFSSLNPVHTIAHHLARPIIVHDRAGSAAEVTEQVWALLALVGLNPPDEIAAKHPHELSGGQRQRVAFARAVAVDPEVVLADEPVSMLDVSIRIDILNLMDRLRRERHLSYLYITHDLASARYIAQSIIVMYAGYAVEGGPTEALLAAPAHPYTRRLIAAVPNLTRAGPRDPSPARAEPPNLVNPAPGCPFAPRCPVVMARCRQIMPEITTLANGRWVRCHYAQETA
jgi:peptide/nickel transport system ATP-binding protein